MTYADRIRSLVTPAFDPRHVEAYMRCEHGTLDALSSTDFDDSALEAVQLIRLSGRDMAEQLALSFGL